MTLCAQQRKLEKLALGPVMCDFARMLERNTLPWTGLTELTVPKVVGNDDLAAYHHIIKRAPWLSRLSVGCNYTLQTTDGKITALPNPSDIIRKRLLPHVKRNDNLTQLKLDELVLNDIHIRKDPTTLLDLSRLQSLCLWHCLNANAVLSAIAPAVADGECALRELTYDVGGSEEFESDLMATLLRSFTGLEKLHLSCDNNNDNEDIFDLSSLDGHKATLETLWIGCNHIDDPFDDVELLDIDYDIFASFSKLRQLAVPLPQCSILNHNNMLPYTRAFESLMSVPSLRVLRLLTFPEAAEGTFAGTDDMTGIINTLNAKAFAHDLDSFVSKVLCKFIRNVTVVCYGGTSDDKTSDDSTEVALPGAYYVVEKRMDPFGNIHVSASRTSLDLASYVEPDIDMENVSNKNWM